MPDLPTRVVDARPGRSPWIALLLAPMLACGGSGGPPATAGRPPQEPWLALAPGARFAITQIFDVTRPGAEPYHREVSLDIDLGDEAPDGLSARAVFIRHGDPVPLAALELTVTRDGTVQPVRMICGGAAAVDVTVTIPHMLALVRGVNSPMLRTDFEPGALAAERQPEEGESHRFRALAQLTDTHFRNLHLTGVANIAASVAYAHDGMPSADVQIAFEGAVTPYREPAQDTTLQIHERIEVTRRSTPLDLLGACDGSPLSTAEVAAGMRTVSESIQECYEHERATQPDLRGSLNVRLTVLPDGSFSDVHVTESTLGAPAVDACIVEIVSRVRIAHGSAAGPATFTFPYSFVP